ncbi:FAD:protein FMN transferase [Caldimonas brevitalea]|uniref:FAD:protein FMN transferase n=1 Tax=Caldimonas brevitalea TaxID=413882 RepID=A0A0G3BMK8_9BURK|nr:FAD:protein FMN transferase [Caldimonas brevitalea]AKJ29223.1 thiamine biosynthesis protein ApbE [Caldimonas brevitalea]
MSLGLSNVGHRAGPLSRRRDRAVAGGAWYSRQEAIMGTPVRVELWSETRAAAEAAMAAVMAEMHRIDRAMSPHKADSELSRLNRDAANGPVPVSDELYELIARSMAFSELSGGAFDITYAAVGHLYDYRRRVRPTEEAVEQARAAVGYRHLLLDPHSRSVRFARAGVRIDLGGFAKGHAVDKSIAILKAAGIRHAMVSAGGDSHVLGDRRGRPWTIAVRDPRRPGEVVAVLPLEDVSISTSGDYERFFEHGQVRFHHLIDPRTGRSPSSVRSVTILAPDGLTSEGLSKSVFMLGVEQGLQLVESMPGVDAVVVDADGVLHSSSGLLPGGGTPQP